MKEIEFACTPEELSCIVGNLFEGLKTPCNLIDGRSLAISGSTVGGGTAGLLIYKDKCVFFGDPEELRAVRKGVCLERNCCHG